MAGMGLLSRGRELSAQEPHVTPSTPVSLGICAMAPYGERLGASAFNKSVPGELIFSVPNKVTSFSILSQSQLLLGPRLNWGQVCLEHRTNICRCPLLS